MDYRISILQTADEKKEGVQRVAMSAPGRCWLSFINVRNGNIAGGETPIGSLGGFVNSDIWVGILLERGDDEYAKH